MFATVDELDYVADKMWPYFQKKFEKQGDKLGDRGDVGWVYFLSKNKIETLADLKGQKLWMWGDDQIVGAMFKKMGLNGVPLGVPEVDAGLTSGKINAAYTSPVAAVALQWYSKVKFMTSMPMSYGIGATVMSIKSFEKLSVEDRKTVETIAKAHSKKLRKVIRTANVDAKTTMTKKGITVVQTPVAMISDFEKAAQDTWKDLTGKVYTKEELDMVLKYRDEFRAKKAPTKK
jgi:TRAP-type C4-dicarboxylate transport system substrate-binding protein